MVSRRVPEFTGRDSGCFPKCLGTRTLYLGQRGKPTRFLESAKGSFAESRGQTPGSLASGSRRREPWRLALESEKDSCLSGETDFVEAFTPSFDPKAQYINRRGRASTQDTSRNTKPCAGNPVPSSLSSVIVSVVLRRSPAKIVLHQHRHHAVVLPELIYYFAPLAGSRRRGRHRAERVQNSEVSCFRYLDRSDREDVRLHQPR